MIASDPCGEWQAVQPFLEGEVAESHSEATLPVISPSTGRLCVSLPTGCEMDVNRAVSSCRRAFDDGRWSEMPPSSKKKILHRLADLIESEGHALDALDAMEMGKPVSEPLANAASAATLTRFYAEAIDKLTGDVYCSDRHSFVAQRRVARGVVAAIVPWNFPTYVAMVKVAPALAAGNCVVLKPSELSPRSAIRLAQLALQAGLPPGVFNVVLGLGDTVGEALALHSAVDMLTFTGSTAVGKRILQYAGQSNLKVVMSECGGKSPHIVCADAIALDETGSAIARMILSNQGQICSAGTRVLVHRSIEAELLDSIMKRMRRVVIGDASDPKTTFGPLASAKQLDRVMRYINAAAESGAQLVIGGERVLQETGGYFVEPTMFASVPPTAAIAQEEIFGPVLTVTHFDDEEQAIRLANSTVYGLAAYVWTADLSRAMRMAKSIRSSVRVNAVPPIGEGAGYATSSEPAGHSGVGTEGGVAGMESYMRRQRLWFNHS